MLSASEYRQTIEDDKSRRWKTDFGPNEEFRERLAAAIAHSRYGVVIYFEPENSFGAETFHSLDRKRGETPRRFRSSDLLAINLLGVHVPPITIRALLLKESETVEDFLTKIDDVDLWIPMTKPLFGPTRSGAGWTISLASTRRSRASSWPGCAHV